VAIADDHTDMGDAHDILVPHWTIDLDQDAAMRCNAALDELGRLPAFDGSVQRILAVLNDPESDNDELLAALSCDASFSANLLQLANSASRAHPIRANSVRQAVMFVGRDALRRLTMETATYRFLERSKGNGRAACGQMHLHALSVALGAAGAAERAGQRGDVAHLAGLLHDIGKLVLPLAFGEDALDAISLKAPAGQRRAEVERQMLGIDHAQAGALLAERWNLPDAIVDAIAWHHGGPNGDVCPTVEVAAVQLANIVAALITTGDADQTLLQAALETAGLHADVLDDLANEAALASSTLVDAARVAYLERLAWSDDLTGIANRRHWMREVRTAVETEGTAGSVLMADVDHFKAINDTDGHQAGDLVLVEVARLMSEFGTAGRLGGDEFVLWMPVPAAVAQAQAATLLQRVSSTFNGVGGASPVSLSIGVADTPGAGTTLDDLIAAADVALYRAKRGGRGRVVCGAAGAPDMSDAA
jgi:diguanylate cyclase (GGDEF)-like protein/putative nucleotidyltransferase with HDIG domain